MGFKYNKIMKGKDYLCVWGGGGVVSLSRFVFVVYNVIAFLCSKAFCYVFSLHFNPGTYKHWI